MFFDFLLFFIIFLTNNNNNNFFISSQDLTTCLQINEMTNNISNITKQRCFDINSNCCYARLRYKIDLTDFDDEYCFPFSGNITKLSSFLFDLYSDEQIWYANLSSFELQPSSYYMIGKQLNYTFYSNYPSYCRQKEENYSVNKNCVFYNGDGSCNSGADKEVKNLMDNLVLNMEKNNLPDCSGSSGSVNKQCNVSSFDVIYQSLAEQLNITGMIGINNINLTDIGNNSTNSTENGTKIEFNLDNVGYDDFVDEPGCVNPPAVQLEIICPDSYVSGNFLRIVFGLKYFLLLIMLF